MFSTRYVKQSSERTPLLLAHETEKGDEKRNSWFSALPFWRSGNQTREGAIPPPQAAINTPSPYDGEGVKRPTNPPFALDLLYATGTRKLRDRATELSLRCDSDAPRCWLSLIDHCLVGGVDFAELVDEELWDGRTCVEHVLTAHDWNSALILHRNLPTRPYANERVYRCPEHLITASNGKVHGPGICFQHNGLFVGKYVNSEAVKGTLYLRSGCPEEVFNSIDSTVRLPR